MKEFKDKIAVITGAGSGIGQALAIELGKKGAILLLSDKNPGTLADTEKLIRTYGANCFCYTVDVADEKAINDFAKQVLKEHKHIDMLFNNAGFALGKISLKDVKMKDFHKIIDVNLWGVINHTKAFLDVLMLRPEAAIINISSVFGIIGMAEQVPYCTTKFAVRGFTEALRMELMDTNVTVHCVHPGGINTNIYKNAVHYERDAELDVKFQKMLERTSPEQAAKIILKGVARKNEKILIGIDAEIIDRLARTMPVGYTSIAKRVFDYTAR
ncbi:MAG: putative short chain dehydrogenase [Bacteroidota bacterium]|nr:putative short chain dehydrogenase [Bacteroidota bacterium]